MREKIKSLHLGKDSEAQIIRSARRSSVFKSIYTIHALGCGVHSAPCCCPRNPPTHTPHPRPYSVFLLSCISFCLSLIKGSVLTESCRKMAATLGGKGYGRNERTFIDLPGLTPPSPPPFANVVIFLLFAGNYDIQGSFYQM